MQTILNLNICFPLLLCMLLEGKEPYKAVLNVQQNGDLVLIDSTALVKKFYFYSLENKMAYYPIFYIGEATDSFVLRQYPIPRHRGAQPRDYGPLRNWAMSFEKLLTIFVDTAMDLAHRSAYGHFSKYPDNDPILDSIRHYSAFPIIVKNHSDSLIQMGIFSEMWRTVRQAQNPAGEWVDIENLLEYACGTGHRDIVLEPGWVLVAKLMRYQGDYKTLCRLKLRSRGNWVYSNTFVDWIDKKRLPGKLRED
ncbi:hypothetical protein [Haliscomenobacter sp.]|uniref:hypothetical protein n=1 Tax=Haliscomenobacter sp. TaxID=2717303 RepID=UPI003593FE8A